MIPAAPAVATPRRRTKRPITSRRRTQKPPDRSAVAPTPDASVAGRGLVVGLGASAGGLEALKAFFRAMPPKTGLVFVVVVHLDPTHESLMPELLANVTGLTVSHAQDRQPLEADHVYVIPPNRTLTIDQGLVRVREVADRGSLRGVIDHFFRSLAVAEGERAVAVVLSGTGTEGTVGARSVKSEGGLVIAQAPETASQPGMPSSVIATGLVDVVAAPEKMPEVILAYRRRAAVTGPAAAEAETEPKSLEGLPAILAVLRARTKHDFRGYKQGTIQRRIERRLGLQQVENVSKYVDFLRSNPAEVDQLYKDLLIGVTSFFRDAAAFEELASTVLADLVRRRDPDVPIRVWVPGCATGEEAYSLAILLAEQIAIAQSSCRVQIFATDIDDDALEVARSGRYPESIALDVTPQRLQRFFTRDDHHYTVAKSIRESAIFAAQDLTSDPPFSKLDLISCRNVLIYLEPEMQEKLLTLFHFALNSGGCLFLGSAEGVGTLEDLFTPVSKRQRIFRRIGPVAHSPLELPLPALAADRVVRAGAKAPPDVATLADQLLLEHFAPAAVVVRSSGQIVRFYGAMERYIKLPRGEATLDVLTLALDPLKPTLRAALYDAVRRNRQTVVEAVDIRRDRRREALKVTVKPLIGRNVADRLWLMLFEEILPLSPAAGQRTGKAQSDLARRLEAELRATKKEQQHLIEQLETGNEELKAANEEVLSMNEELQSTNEELTTSKEELQSMNEELTTLNQQLQEKLHELTAVNDDLANLLVSTDIATVFLDTELRIKRFTVAASHVLNLRSSDAGRPLSHIAPNLLDVDLSGDARSVMNTLTPIAKEVIARDGRNYFTRVLPYRTADGAVQGVVLTLVDVTGLKEAEREVRAAREQVAEDLRRMTRLHKLGSKLMAPGDVNAMLEEVLRAAVEITVAEKGYVQISDEGGGLSIAAQAGFEAPFLDFFTRVDAQINGARAAPAIRERVIVEDVTTSPMFADSASLPVLLAAGVRALQSTPLLDRAGRFLGLISTHYRAPRRFAETELVWLDMLARHAADVIERQRADELLARSHEELERRVTERTKWLTLMHDVTRAINDAPTWDEGLHRVLRRICETEHWQIGFVYLPDRDEPDFISATISCYGDERFQPFHRLSEHQRYARGERLPGRVYSEGVAVWANTKDALLEALPVRAEMAIHVGLKSSVALPIRSGQEVIAVLELFSDAEHPPTDMLGNLMNDVSLQIGKVLDRERTTAHMADLLWSEQQALLHTLHDTLGQTLTAIGMLSSALTRRLGAAEAETLQTAQEIAHQAQQALDQVRHLTKSLFPLEVEAESLLVALRDLATTTESLHKIRVRVEGKVPDALRDGGMAMQLYRIAQEAITNVIKHAQATTITIEMDGEPGLITLRITDDGSGIKDVDSTTGMGLRIMRYRASSVGGVLSVEPGAKGGTVVTCAIRAVPPALKPAGV